MILSTMLGRLCRLPKTRPDARISRAALHTYWQELVYAAGIVLLLVPATTAPARTAEVLNRTNYTYYRQEHADAERPDHEIVVPIAEARATGDHEIRTDFEGAGRPVLWTGETGSVSWSVDVPETGLYNVTVEYFPVTGNGAAIERALLINGQRPFHEARSIILQRIWRDAADIEQDNRGNDLRPVQIESPEWTTTPLRNVEGYYAEPYAFYLESGRQQITLQSVREPVVYGAITIHQAESPPPYQQALREWHRRSLSVVEDVMVVRQAERTQAKSDPSLYPIFDRSTPATEPSHPYLIRLNAVGGNSWRLPGQWIRWEIEVPSDGLYQLSFKSRQNMVRGVNSYRTLRVNGEVPFAEARQISFAFDRDWQLEPLTDPDGEPYLIPLRAGTNTISLEVTLGDLSAVIRRIEQTVFSLNNVYRTIVMITGPAPDPFRDYRLEYQIPDLIENLQEASQTLRGVIADLQSLTGEVGGTTAVPARLVRQISDMIERPETIPDRLDQFQINVGALSFWIYDVRQLPLELDYLVISSPDQELPSPRVGFLRRAAYAVSSFAASFFVDYDIIGNTTDQADALEVWYTLGRAQAQIVKSLIDEQFTRETGLGVELKLVDQQIIRPAVFAGKGPDVLMNQSRADPIDFALRSGVLDLTQFPDFEEVSDRFHPSAVEPFRWNDGVYALPERQYFDVMFYRIDVMEELGLDIPQTWNDVYELIPELQKRNLDFGLPWVQVTPGSFEVQPINPAFAMFLYQNDGTFYREGGREMAIDQEEAIQAFQRWSQFYSAYKLPLEFSLWQRLRTGEMPIGIGYFNLYNVLTVSAPELRGLWTFGPVPGTRLPDGSIDRAVSSDVKGVTIVAQTDQPRAGWEYLRWWTSTQAQTAFGREMVTVLGPAGRWETANLEAFSRLSWPIDVINALEIQRESVRGIPEVPGGYFTGRHLENAFREVVFEGFNPRDTLLDYIEVMNEEIRSKRREFGLD